MAGESILVVDDNDLNLKLVEAVLSRHGFTVRTAGDGAEMNGILETLHPHLILMDIQLPDIDGLELARRLKADPRTRDVRIVALTAYAMKGDERKALDAGCDGYIAKPIDTRAFGKQVAAFLR